MEADTYQSAPTVLMVANYPRDTGYAWWLMERFWDEIEHAATVRGWRHLTSYPPSEVVGKRPETGTEIEPGVLEADLAAFPPRRAYRVFRLIRRYRVRAVYLTDHGFRSWRYLLLRLAGVKRIVVHDHTPGDRPPIHGIRGALKAIANRLPCVAADRIVAISPLMKTRHLENARVPLARIATVTNGIPIRELLPGSRERLIAAAGIPPGAFIIVGIGRLSAYKGFDFSVRCLARLVAESPSIDAFLVLIGDGPERARLASLAADLGVTERLVLLGKVDDAWPLLCGCDAFLHPSRGEGLSLAILEATAAAKPVVVPDIPSVCQTVTNGENGLVYRDGEVQDAVNALSRLASDPKLRDSLGAEARAKVKGEHNIERMLESFRREVVEVLLL